MATVEQFYQTWSAQSDNQARNRLLAGVLGGKTNEAVNIPDYCGNLKVANEAISKAWGNIEEETAPRYNCLVGETAQEGKKKCFVEWWPDDNTHIVTPRFDTEAEAKAFAAYVFASFELE